MLLGVFKDKILRRRSINQKVSLFISGKTKFDRKYILIFPLREGDSLFLARQDGRCNRITSEQASESAFSWSGRGLEDAQQQAQRR